MSNASVDTGSTASAGHPGMGATGRAALAAAVIAIAIVAALLVAHAVKGSPKAAASPTGHSGMTMTSPSSASSAGMSSPSGMPVGQVGANAVMTVRGAALPKVPVSGMPVAMTMVPLGQTVWDGMRIQARTSAPATFLLFNGTSQHLVTPTAKDSFHLMVTLSDSESNYAIPYSSVWATMRKGGKIVLDERLWPMISRYMGPHYGDNVALPSAGLYHLTLLVSPPVAARHLEYKGLWLKPHRVNLTFRWVPRT